MIQRIQTVWYFLALCAAVATLFVPAWISAESEIISVMVFLPFTIAIGILSAAILTTIISFKKRLSQLKLGSFTIIIAFLLLVAIWLPVFTTLIPNINNVSPTIGSYLPLAIILFTALGNFFVKKDEKLVKSMDRLR